MLIIMQISLYAILNKWPFDSEILFKSSQASLKNLKVILYCLQNDENISDSLWLKCNENRCLERWTGYAFVKSRN